MNNIVKNLAYFIGFGVLFLVLRFGLAVTLGALLASSVVNVVFWGIQIIVLLWAIYYFLRKQEKVTAFLVLLAFALSFVMGPME